MGFDKDDFKKELTARIIPFWESLADRKNGGFCGSVDMELNADFNAFKGCILQSRILWFFSESYILLKGVRLREYADLAYKFIDKHCFDKKHGGMYWSVTAEGKPCDTTKHTYVQAFAVYALSAYYRAVKNKKALKRAMELFRLIESKCKDEGGYLEAFSVDFTPSDNNDKLSENGVMASRTMNTLLHIIEAYTGLLQATGDKAVKEALKQALKVFVTDVYSKEKNRLEVFFDNDMNSLIDLNSYGHDIEASWLMRLACEVIGEDEITSLVEPVCLKLAEGILDRGYTPDGVMDECCNGWINTTRVWWVQAEAVLGFAKAYKAHPEREDFAAAAQSVWEYTKTAVIDSRPHSEWFWETVPDGRHMPYEMAGEWKCPYHNGRMCIEMIMDTQ